jgi:hypothetical protein
MEAPVAVTTLANFPPQLASAISSRAEWKVLYNPKEWARLQKALIEFKGASSRSSNEN